MEFWGTTGKAWVKVEVGVGIPNGTIGKEGTGRLRDGMGMLKGGIGGANGSIGIPIGRRGGLANGAV